MPSPYNVEILGMVASGRFRSKEVERWITHRPMNLLRDAVALAMARERIGQAARVVDPLTSKVLYGPHGRDPQRLRETFNLSD